jgi:hypothetical protein
VHRAALDCQLRAPRFGATTAEVGAEWDASIARAGSTALLVVWIARRRANEYWLRVSIHSPLKREVLLEKRAVLMPDEHDFSAPGARSDISAQYYGSSNVHPGTD